MRRLKLWTQARGKFVFSPSGLDRDRGLCWPGLLWPFVSLQSHQGPFSGWKAPERTHILLFQAILRFLVSFSVFTHLGSLHFWACYWWRPAASIYYSYLLQCLFWYYQKLMLKLESSIKNVFCWLSLHFVITVQDDECADFDTSSFNISMLKS